MCLYFSHPFIVETRVLFSTNQLYYKKIKLNFSFLFAAVVCFKFNHFITLKERRKLSERNLFRRCVVLYRVVC